MSAEQLNAQLFLRLAEFVVWATKQDEYAARDAEFARLRKRCAEALAPAPDAKSGLAG